MALAKKQRLTKAEAEKQTTAVVKEFNRAHQLAIQVISKIQSLVDRQAHVAEGLRLDEWLQKHFKRSASYLFARLQQRKALHAIGVPDSKIDRIPESNARQLARLPEKYRKQPETLAKAETLEPKQFKEVVNEIREKKMGITPEPWRTFAVRMPLTVYERLQAAEEKVAKVLSLDLADEEKHAWHQITIWEAIAQLVNDTPEERLKLETEGDECAVPATSTES